MCDHNGFRPALELSSCRAHRVCLDWTDADVHRSSFVMIGLQTAMPR